MDRLHYRAERRWQGKKKAIFALWIGFRVCRHCSALSVHGEMACDQRLLIFGLGRVGQEVAKRSQDAVPGLIRFAGVAGTTRRERGETKTGGVILVRPDEAPKVAMNCTHILITVPPPSEAREHSALESLFDNIALKVSASAVKTRPWIGVVSTTSVYGNHDGGWVTEDSECRCPKHDSSSPARFWRHEQCWRERAARHKLELCIFRCAGLYGPTRSALHTVYRTGITQSAQTENDVTNRIHEHDVARAILSAMTLHTVNRRLASQVTVYNLSDNRPESRSTVMNFAARLLRENGVALPAHETVKTKILESNNRRNRRENHRKLVSSERMIEALLCFDSGLLYPSYKDGLSAILVTEAAPWNRPSEKAD